MSTISSLSSSASASLFSTQRAQRPDPSKMIDKLFSQLDSAGKGYLEKSDLASAFSQISGSGTSSSSSSAASVDDVFSQLDSSGDGKVTKEEMSTGMKKLADQLDSQFNQTRMSGGMPPSDDAGFTKDQLSSQLSETGSTNGKRSALISKVVNNFDKADTDGNGKVSFAEAQAYDQSTSSSSSTASTSAASSSASDTSQTSNELAIMKRIMDLMQAYASNDASSSNRVGTLSVSA